MNDYPHYSSNQKWIHWLSALLVTVVIVLPLLRGSIAPYLGGMANLFMLHKSLGVVIFLLTLWRLVVIIQYGVPEVLPSDARLQRIVAKAVQGLIYLLLLLLPLSGYLMSSRAISLFNIVSLPAPTLSVEVAGFFRSLHLVAAYGLIILLCIHVAAACYHHFWLKDNVLRSMLAKRSAK